ncbi:MAG: hypothetical protein M1831_002730 [Alyxoria varia]|nr:MAG: hypothetical protein M1831_002730 [Alyxoria varia]
MAEGLPGVAPGHSRSPNDTPLPLPANIITPIDFAGNRKLPEENHPIYTPGVARIVTFTDDFCAQTYRKYDTPPIFRKSNLRSLEDIQKQSTKRLKELFLSCRARPEQDKDKRTIDPVIELPFENPLGVVCEAWGLLWKSPANCRDRSRFYLAGYLEPATAPEITNPATTTRKNSPGRDNSDTSGEAHKAVKGPQRKANIEKRNECTWKQFNISGSLEFSIIKENPYVMANEVGQYREDLKNSAIKQRAQLALNRQTPSPPSKEQTATNISANSPAQPAQDASSLKPKDDQKPTKAVGDTIGSSGGVTGDEPTVKGGQPLDQSKVSPPENAQDIHNQPDDKPVVQHAAASEVSPVEHSSSEAKAVYHDSNSIQESVDSVNHHNDENDSSNVDGSKSDIKHERTNSSKKQQPSYRKVESAFLKNKPVQSSPAKPTAEQASNTSVSPAPAAGKPRLVPKSGRDNRSVVPGSKAGGSTGSDSGTVWNRQSKPSSKTLTDEELVKHYGISMTERLPSHEAENRSNWADIEDEESWNPADAVMGIMDGAKPKSNSVENKPAAPTEVEKSVSHANAETNQEVKTTLAAPDQSEVSTGSGKAILKPGGKSNATQLKPGVKLRSAPEVLSAPADSSKETSVKSPWAEVPKPDSASPINFHPVPALENKQGTPKDSTPPADQVSHTSLPNGPAVPQEIDADDFNRSWRSEEKGSRELFDSRSGRYEPAKGAVRRQSIRQEGGQAAPPSVLQRPGHARQTSHQNLSGGDAEESGIDGYVRTNLNINIETAREQRRLRLEEEEKQEQAKNDRLRAKMDALLGPSPQGTDSRTEEESKNDQDLNTTSNDRTDEKPSTTGVGSANAPKVDNTATTSHTSPGPQALPTQPLSKAPSDTASEYVQAWNKAWSNTTASNPTGTNVWGPLSNDKMIGNGSFESTLKSIPDLSSKPGPIAPPSSTKPKEGNGNSSSRSHQGGSLMNNKETTKKAPSKAEVPSYKTDWKAGILAAANTPFELSRRNQKDVQTSASKTGSADFGGWSGDWKKTIADEDRSRSEALRVAASKSVHQKPVFETSFTNRNAGTTMKQTFTGEHHPSGRQETKNAETGHVATNEHPVAGRDGTTAVKHTTHSLAGGNDGVKEVVPNHPPPQDSVSPAPQASQKPIGSTGPREESKPAKKSNGKYDLASELLKATTTPFVKAQWKEWEENHKGSGNSGFEGWAQTVQEDDRKKSEAVRAASQNTTHAAPVFQSTFTKTRTDETGQRIVDSIQASDHFISNDVSQHTSLNSTQESPTETQQQLPVSAPTTANGRVSRFFGAGVETKPSVGDSTQPENITPPSPPPDVEAGLFDDGEVNQIMINLPNLGDTTHSVHSPKGVPKVKLPPTPVSPHGEKEPNAIPGRVQIRTGPQPIVNQAEWQMRFDGLLNRSFSGGVGPQSPMGGTAAPSNATTHVNDGGPTTGGQPAISPGDAYLLEPFSLVAAKPSEGELYDEPEHGSTPAVKLANIDGYYAKAPRPVPRGRPHVSEKGPEFSSTKVELQFFRFEYNGVMIMLPGKDPRRDRKLLRSRPPRRPTPGKGTTFPKNKPNKAVRYGPQQGGVGGQAGPIKKDSSPSLFSKGRFHALSDGQTA